MRTGFGLWVVKSPRQVVGGYNEGEERGGRRNKGRTRENRFVIPRQENDASFNPLV